MSGGIADIAARTLAQQGLVDFAKRCSPGFQSPKHVLYLAALLERVERGEIRRLAISAPPGHGKSSLLQCFVAWFLGRDPERRVLAISATESLAKRNSRATQQLVTSDKWPFDAGLRGESVLEWSTTQGGEVRAIGRSGNVTGFRAECILADDIQSDAGSDATRASDEEWFRSVLSTRLEPNGVVCLIQTRWTDDDLVGRLIDGESGDQWTVVNLAAIAGDDDLLGREHGEALWPERWPVDLLEKKKAEIGSGAFSAQYQGDPVPAGGAIFRPEWFDHRFDAAPVERLREQTAEMSEYERSLRLMYYGEEPRHRPKRPIIVQAIDSAWKAGLSNDRSVIATLLSDFRDIYVLDVWFGRLDYTDLRRIVVQQYDKYRPRCVYVEEAASGYAIVDELRKSTAIPVIGVKPGRDSKEARAEAVTGWFESGRVKFPKSAPWMAELLNEFLRFPSGRHDDIVDAVTLGVAQMEKAIARVLSDERFAEQTRHISFQR